MYCLQKIEKIRIRVPINSIWSLGLKGIVLVLARITALASLHQDSRPIMFYAVECMRLTIYDWRTSFLNKMKQKLTDCKMGRKRNFQFARILSKFFFKPVPGLIPRV